MEPANRWLHFFASRETTAFPAGSNQADIAVSDPK